MTGRDERGFALIELLIALALVGLIAAMLSGMVQRTVRLTVDGGERLSAATRSETVRDLLRRQLQSALPLQLSDGEGSGVAFLGESDRMQWAGSRSGDRGDDIYWLRIDHLAEPADQGTGALVMHRRLFDPAQALQDQTNPEETIILFSDVAEMKIAYFDDATWRGRWTDPRRLPPLIRIDLRLTDDADGRWSSLVIAPRLTQMGNLAGVDLSFRQGVKLALAPAGGTEL